MCVNIIYVCICLYCVICLILYYRSLLICTNKEFMNCVLFEFDCSSIIHQDVKHWRIEGGGQGGLAPPPPPPLKIS